MFEVYNNITKIDGKNGLYDGHKLNPSVKYGRNAVENLNTYYEAPIVNNDYNPAPILDLGTNPNVSENNITKIENFIQKNDKYLDSLPPLQYEYRYMPNLTNGKIDTQALFGAAYEEMGQTKEIDVNDIDKMYGDNSELTSKAIDLNNDNKIDVAEYSTTILAADMLSKSSDANLKNIDGTINNTGANAVLSYAQKSKIDAANALYSKIYNNYNLADEYKNFNA